MNLNKIEYKFTIRDIIAISFLLVLLAYCIFIRVNYDGLIFYKVDPYNGYIWNTSLPAEYSCKALIYGAKCEWSNVPVGLDNTYFSKQHPFMFMIYKNQNVIGGVLLLLAALIFWISKKNIKKNA